METKATAGGLRVAGGGGDGLLVPPLLHLSLKIWSEQEIAKTNKNKPQSLSSASQVDEGCPVFLKATSPVFGRLT